MPEISNSPLAPHFDLDINGIASWPVRPRAVKVFTASHAREVKALDPRIKTVLRRYHPDQGAYLVQGEAGGRRWVNEITDLTGVDMLEGVNESTGFDDFVAIQANNAFHIGFVQACVQRGVKPVSLNIAVGNPLETLVKFLAPCVQATLQAGGLIGYHGYAPVDMLHGEEFLANRGPLKLTPLLQAAGVALPIKWIYTEAGLDFLNSPVLNGPIGYVLGRVWNGQVVTESIITAQHDKYARRLVQLGVEIAFLFTFRGEQTWADYEYLRWQKIKDWYIQHLVDWKSVPVPPPTPVFPRQARVIATNGLRVRLTPDPGGIVIGSLAFNPDLTKFDVKILSVQNGWARSELKFGDKVLIAGASDPDPAGYAASEWLEFAP